MARDYGKRIIICIAGLTLYALGTVFGVFAGAAGTNGWNTLAIGLAGITGMSFGTAVFAIGTALQASFFQFACRLCRFEPRQTENEDLADTFRKIHGIGAGK